CPSSLSCAWACWGSELGSINGPWPGKPQAMAGANATIASVKKNVRRIRSLRREGNPMKRPRLLYVDRPRPATNRRMIPAHSKSCYDYFALGPVLLTQNTTHTPDRRRGELGTAERGGLKSHSQPMDSS